MKSLGQKEQELFARLDEVSEKKAGMPDSFLELSREEEKTAGTVQDMASLLGEIKRTLEVCAEYEDDLFRISSKWGEISKQKVIM